jgi:hypothetical protein
MALDDVFDKDEAFASGVTLEDFFALMPAHSYIFAPSRELWPAASVNSRLPPFPVGEGKTIPASKWLDQNRPVEQLTWALGRPGLVRGVPGGAPEAWMDGGP